MLMISNCHLSKHARSSKQPPRPGRARAPCTPHDARRCARRTALVAPRWGAGAGCASAAAAAGDVRAGAGAGAAAAGAGGRNAGRQWARLRRCGWGLACECTGQGQSLGSMPEHAAAVVALATLVAGAAAALEHRLARVCSQLTFPLPHRPPLGSSCVSGRRAWPLCCLWLQFRRLSPAPRASSTTASPRPGM